MVGNIELVVSLNLANDAQVFIFGFNFPEGQLVKVSYGHGILRSYTVS